MKDFEDYLDATSWNNTRGLYKVVDDMLYSLSWLNMEEYENSDNKKDIVNKYYFVFLEQCNYDENEIEFATQHKYTITREFVKKYDKL